MKIASFNVENMFRRAVVLNQDNWKDGKAILEAYAALTEILEQPAYSDADKGRILDLLEKLGLLSWDENGSGKKARLAEDNKWVWLRRSRGRLVSVHRDGTIEVAAGGRGDWIGWLELKREEVNEQATRNTAGVIADMDPDILAVVEAEDRPALVRFNENVLKLDQGEDKGFGHVMLIDGNDERGIDVGMLAKDSFPVVGMRSHVDDPGPGGEPVFSRDCAEYEFDVNGEKLLLLVNHFKSKGFGKASTSNARREAQAKRVAEIYKERTKEGWKNIVVLGDFNDTPDSGPLAPLLKKTDLKDASQAAGWVWGEREGTFGGGKKEKIDYLLLSPALFGKVKAGGVNRKGLWHGDRTRNPWELLPTLTKEQEAASDHAAIWVELDM
ncbi:MAG TPA: endonuclease/exonuclease/phosphatase family protein [Solirubrobacterales bacterium]|nr:endonuclease/exonuclease/phosphatase family protein [Solirubrobacterales bacterium]